MKHFYSFCIHPSFSLDKAWQELEEAGIELSYGSEEGNDILIYGYLNTAQTVPLLKSVISYQPAELPIVDWEAQWALHGWDFQEGMVHIQLGQFGFKDYLLKLHPGPGFGDLSHPTTRMVLRLMGKYLNSQFVIDVGCGSGILTLAAAATGTLAYGIDIDSQALEHARQNARLNGLMPHCQFFLPSDFHLSSSDPFLATMNMILSEQKEAWHSLPSLHSRLSRWITSGIRKEEKEKYLALTHSWNWQCIEEVEEEGWMAFVF